MKLIKILALFILVLLVLIPIGGYLLLSSSLPELDGDLNGLNVDAAVELSRDNLGTAVIKADSMRDAAFALGYAHAQDRLFQMDLLRRNSAGELSELFGQLALNNDKKHRFHQFRKRARDIVYSLPAEQKALIDAYTDGVNTYVSTLAVPTFEYIITQTEFRPWVPEDTILATFAMYIDLQLSQVERDFNFTGIKHFTSSEMLEFFTQPSPFQATMDFSEVPAVELDIPQAPVADVLTTLNSDSFKEPKDIGSNNWAINGTLSKNNRGGIVANDMHLGLNVPTLWYKTQLNFKHLSEKISVTGVSLPGTPLVIVGATDNIAWGFTNSGIDNVDWISLEQDSPITTQAETINIKGTEPYVYEIPMSDIGPVRYIDEKPLALKWVAHKDYAINLAMGWLPIQENVEDALALAKTVRIPVQNMVIADRDGNVAWQLTGAITSRKNPSNTAIPFDSYDPVGWSAAELFPANEVNPEHGKIWSANARMVSAVDLPRYGNGGYALGIRQKQIADSLMETSTFDEQTFYDLQLDNRAIYLAPWHDLLLTHLRKYPELFSIDIGHLNNWQACACSDSVGYSLVRRFRNELISQLLQPLRSALEPHDIRISALWRSLEPSVWQMLKEQPESWLGEKHESYDDLIRLSYETARQKLFDQHANGLADFQAITWGKVNELTITHPLAGALGPLGDYLNMPTAAGFGDSFMPAVQSRKFGASQRLFAQPGNLENAILTVPGGQSMHPLSKFYFAGFSGYVENEKLPLLPGRIQHVIMLNP